jgi:hypothetical protein
MTNYNADTQSTDEATTTERKEQTLAEMLGSLKDKAAARAIDMGSIQMTAEDKMSEIEDVKNEAEEVQGDLERLVNSLAAAIEAADGLEEAMERADNVEDTAAEFDIDA